MHIELIDLLRCPNDHEETWLVAALNAVEDRFVIKARLGCPVCGASYVISSGIADLRSHREDRPAPDDRPAHPDPDAVIRISALLNLTRPGALAILEGAYAAPANQIGEMTQCRIMALNSSGAIADTELTASVLSGSRIPFAAASADGLALEDLKFLDDAARVLRPGGRLLIPARAALPAGITEVARDATSIVGEAAGQVIQLRR